MLIRSRRLRSTESIRALVRETSISPNDFLVPLFVTEGNNIKEEIASMPNYFRFSLDLLEKEIKELWALGLKSVLLFVKVPDELKDNKGTEALNPEGLMQRAVKTVKNAVPEMLVMTDVCFCEYTSHGHCGAINDKTGRMDVDNDATLDMLAQQAVSHARAGADVVAPSGMMDGMVGAIRGGLDGAGFAHVPILSYAVKYASAFYGPFREAAESAPQSGDRRGYQMDPAASAEQALREAALDLVEGADLLMVKPALAYLDIIRLVHDRFPGVPLAAYNVSGEYSMVKAAAERGWIDERAIAMESLTAIRRAGASIVITYWAKQVAQWLR